MILEHFVVGMLQTNCYLLADPETKQAVVIDPGGDGKRIAGRIKSLELDLEAVLITHAHSDHIMDAWSLKESCGGKIYLHPNDMPLLANSVANLAARLKTFAGGAEKKVDRNLNDNETLTFGSIRLEVLSTPGHTPGHVSFHCPERKIVFVGDTLFAGSIGRTDFPGGSYNQLIRSVREKLFPLDGDTIVYSGHGPSTQIEREKRTNPFFR